MRTTIGLSSFVLMYFLGHFIDASMQYSMLATSLPPPFLDFNSLFVSSLGARLSVESPIS